MAFKVHIEPRALEEIDEAYSWYLERTTHAAGWLDGLLEAIGTLSESPGRCPVSEKYSHVLGRRIHRLLYNDNFLVFFEVDESTSRVSVLRVRHTSRRALESE